MAICAANSAMHSSRKKQAKLKLRDLMKITQAADADHDDGVEHGQVGQAARQDIAGQNQAPHADAQQQQGDIQEFMADIAVVGGGHGRLSPGSPNWGRRKQARLTPLLSHVRGAFDKE